jgi:hypothetical protein
MGQKRTHALQQKRSLVDHFVGEGEQFIWDSQAKCLGGGEIND